MLVHKECASSRGKWRLPINNGAAVPRHYKQPGQKSPIHPLRMNGPNLVTLGEQQQEYAGYVWRSRRQWNLWMNESEFHKCLPACGRCIKM